MKLRWFAPFILAALLLGTPVRAPRLRAPIPDERGPACDYEAAVRDYLLAYAYAAERPAVARKFLGAADAERARCPGDTAPLAARIRALSTSIP
jgi:hypothetical protein